MEENARLEENSTSSPVSKEAEEREESQLPPPSQSRQPSSEPRKCWICFSDETEDTPTSSVWRSPCPCALTAHEACLLDWVADLEAPNGQHRTGRSKKIECPQCKSKITIARPHSYIVQGVNAVEQIGGKLVLPGIIVTLLGSIITGCWVHGVTSVYLIFGSEDANTLLGVDTGNVSTRWGIGAPFIPIVLILSRTTIADNLLPILPFLVFATQFPDMRPSRKQLWPPSAAMTLATLPYIRGAYNEMYKRLFAEREKRWIKEVQPRSGEAGNDTGDGHEHNAGANGNLDVADVGFNLNLEVEIFEEHIDVPNNEDQQQQEQPGQGNPGPDQPAAQPAQPQRANNLIVSTSRVADTILGALLFPTVSAAMGAILKTTLPTSWTAGPVDRKGLLQSRWGRSIVGGCLFLVFKDTLLLYSRYRLAQDHRKRRVLNYDGKKGKGHVH